MRALVALMLLTTLATCVSSSFGATVHARTKDDALRSRSKRNVMNFGLIIKCTTNRNPTDYNQYGCYCGMGGSGTPVDAVDSCCQTHDQCWNRVKRQHKCQDGYFAVYSWTCQKDRPMGCEANQDVCSREYCKCDAETAMCFARHRYSEYYRNWQGSCRANSKLPDWAQKAMQAINRIPADFIPHLGRVSTPARGGAAAAATIPAQVPAVPAQPDKPVMISLPGTGPDMPANPGFKQPATAAPQPVTQAPRPRETRPDPPRGGDKFSIPGLIGRILGGLPWRSIFGGKK